MQINSSWIIKKILNEAELAVTTRNLRWLAIGPLRSDTRKKMGSRLIITRAKNPTITNRQLAAPQLLLSY